MEGIKPQIKWPNDIVIGGKKICGILTEMSSEGEDIKYVVVGIGINIYNREFRRSLRTGLLPYSWKMAKAPTGQRSWPVLQMSLRGFTVCSVKIRIWDLWWMSITKCW